MAPVPYLCILFTLSVFIAFNELTFIFYQLCIHKANQIKGIPQTTCQRENQNKSAVLERPITNN